MTHKNLIPFLFFLYQILRCAFCYSQTGYPVNGIHDERQETYAFVNANIFIDYKTFVPSGTLIIEKSSIKSVGKNIQIPKNAIVIDLKQKFIYPSFVDLHTQYGIVPATRNASGVPQPNTNIKGAYNWNEAIKSYQEGHKLFANNPEEAKAYRSAGFGTVLSFQHDGIARGTASLISLCDKRENECILIEKASSHYSFHKGTSMQDYPTSLMGAIALLRQTFYDAQWYDTQTDKKETHIALSAINNVKKLPLIFEVSDKQNLLRADKLGDEFGIQFIIKGSGDEYQNIEAVKSTNAPVIVPVHFPQAFDVEDAIDSKLITYHQLKHWELAPFNLYYLNKAAIPFAVTSSGLKDKNMIFAAMRKAIKAGLPSSDALMSLTSTPARLIKADNKIGALRPGMMANFLICSDSIFKEETVLYENWVGGRQFIINEIPAREYRGVYQVVLKQNRKKPNYIPDTITMSISGQIHAPEFEIYKDTVKSKAIGKLSFNYLSLVFDWKKKPVKLSGWYDSDVFKGVGAYEDGTSFTWVAHLDLKYQTPILSDSARKVSFKVKIKDDSVFRAIGKILYPFCAYGTPSLPKAKTVLFKNATLWTNESQGIIKNTDLLISQGKILEIGKINSKADTIIDAIGMHITPGIIDEHSHIAISGGVNECSHSITAEVRIGDILDAEDINIYRDLAGGVTAVQVLHGSCNAIGGQSGIIKLRWGSVGEDLKIKNADGFIKFALGENVKQSNWGDAYYSRYPQSRMGVEQLYMNAFARAAEYRDKMKSDAAGKTRFNARKDLQLDALVEILNKKRFITCHSYVQSEIVMLMRLTESFGIRVNTFTHILEGYKVADKMRAHGAGGSTFADWWAYKMEVKDAIPYNAALMHKAGVVTAINSDNAEMSRRLNQEAAKVIKYGNIPEEEALKMITLNPAKLLHLDRITGSLKVGKDADIVLWSDHPLSIQSKTIQTYVDGICLFDIQKDQQTRMNIEIDKQRIINKMREAKKNGEPTQKPAISYQHLWDCEETEKP